MLAPLSVPQVTDSHRQGSFGMPESRRRAVVRLACAAQESRRYGAAAMTLDVRRATKKDLKPVARLAAQLIALHHQWDPQRFFTVENSEEGYAWFLGTQLKAKNAVVLLATVDSEIAGYLYGTVESRDWAMFLDDHGVVHDVLVDERFRRQGVAKALMIAGLKELEAMGAPRIVLHTATANTQAQALFETLGFRRTMVEMTRG
jgi:ribosomal protein S18 acetylase RimI-like enzyme